MNNKELFEKSNMNYALQEMLRASVRALLISGHSMEDVDKIVNEEKVQHGLRVNMPVGGWVEKKAETPQASGEGVPDAQVVKTRVQNPMHLARRLNKPLIDYGFRQRALTALEKHGITHIAQLLRMTEKGLLELPGVGVGLVESIVDTLRSNQLYLPEAAADESQG
jgi:hypothetical protein